jgi:hypothetical protein
MLAKYLLSIPILISIYYWLWSSCLIPEMEKVPSPPLAVGISLTASYG